MPDRLHILLVDDEEVDRQAVRRAFLRSGIKATIREEADLAGARVALVRRRFDCAIVDYSLPDGSALDLVRRPESDLNALPPVIILTGQGSEAVAVESMKAGAADYLPKAELSVSRLSQSVRNAIRLREAENLARRANESLRASERRFRELFESSPDPILVQDLEGIVLDANPAACRLHGYERTELIGLDRSDLGPPTAPHSGDNGGSIERLAAGRLTHAEAFTRHRSGHAVPVEIRAARIDYDGQPAALLHLRDVTERRRAEAALRESERRFRRTADTAPVMIWVVNANGRATYFNKPWLDYTGLTLRQALDRGWDRCIHPDELRHCREFYNASFSAHRTFRMEYRLRRRDGRYRWLLDSGTPRFTPDGAFAGYIGSCIDVTSLKRARDELERRVAERTADLTRTNRQLGQEISDRLRAEERATQLRSQLAHVSRLSTMGEMASGLAHELNQPLGAIVNYLQGSVRMLESGSPDTDRLADALRKGAAQAERAGQIIHRLRAFVSKGESIRTAEDANGLIREVAELIAVEARQAHVALSLRLADALPPVFTDRIQAQQVLLNLMRNGIEAMVEAGADPRTLTVSTQAQEPGAVRIAVSDSGPGASPEDLARLFDPFFTTKSSGMGMGLAISRSIVEAHGGRLWATPNDHTPGITFRFTLPTTTATPDANDENAPAQSPQSAPLAAPERA